MKLLLTSGGLRNDTLVKAFLELVNIPADKIKVAFIPTAMNVQDGDKGWAVDQMMRLRNIGIGQLDIVDVSALTKDIWLPRLQESDAIFVNGGNTTHLMKSFNNSGLSDEMAKLLEDRVYVGASAGSYVATPDIRFNSDGVEEVLDGLKLVDFGLQVHLESPNFEFAKDEETVRKRIADANCPYTVYSFDDETAIRVDGDNMDVVGEGKYIVVEP